MDIVIPFVDCSDKVWMKNYLKEILSVNSFLFRCVEFYDHGTLKYVFRGIDKYIPYVNNVFLVVSNIEQVPNYVDKSKVKVVLHKDFIPEKYLPLFSSSTIELFLNEIPGLGEEFLYFNDDIIPISPVPYEYLFKNGIPCINFENGRTVGTPSYRRASNSFYEAKNTVEILTGNHINYHEEKPYMPIHGPIPLLKSVCDDAKSVYRHNDIIDFYSSKFRNIHNLNQYYWSDILFFENKYLPSEVKLKYTTTLEISNLDINEIQKGYNYICINDYGTDEYTLSQIDDIIKSKLDIILPNKCKYETTI